MLSPRAQFLIRDVDVAMRAEQSLSEPALDALNALIDGVESHHTVEALCPLFEAWLDADAAEVECLGDLRHAFSQLHKYQEGFGVDEIARTSELLTEAEAQSQNPTAHLAWIPFRAACEGFQELSGLCDAFTARQRAEKQATAQVLEGLRRLVLELRSPALM